MEGPLYTDHDRQAIADNHFAVEGARVGISFQKLVGSQSPWVCCTRALSQGQRMGLPISRVLLATFRQIGKSRAAFMSRAMP